MPAVWQHRNASREDEEEAHPESGRRQLNSLFIIESRLPGTIKVEVDVTEMWQLINNASRERDSCRRRRLFFGSSTTSTQGTRVPVNDSRHFSSQKSEIVIPDLPSRLTFRSRSERNEKNVYCLLQYLVPSRTNFAYEQRRSSPKKTSSRRWKQRIVCPRNRSASKLVRPSAKAKNS